MCRPATAAVSTLSGFMANGSPGGTGSESLKHRELSCRSDNAG